jgi:hypothetical protein
MRVKELMTAPAGGYAEGPGHGARASIGQGLQGRPEENQAW